MSTADPPASALLAGEAERHALLQAIVELTRAVFAARACSLMSHDPSTRELVFEAIAGEGAILVGRRIPATTGLAGWSLASEEPIAVMDTKSDPRFAREVAEETGYVPTRLSVHPLLHDERSLGVLSVLDQGTGSQVGLADMSVLGQIATHAAAVLALVLRARELEATGAGRGALSRLERALAAAPPGQRAAALAALAGIEDLLLGDE